MAMKKTTAKKATIKKPAAKKPMMKRGGAKKPLRKAQTGTSFDDEYNRNYAKTRDADREIGDILSQRRNWSNQDLYNKIRRGISDDPSDWTMTPKDRLEKYGKVINPNATDRDMAQYDKDIAAFYKANPNIKPYVGTLKTKPATPIQKKGGVTKSTVKKVTVKAKRKR